MMTLKLTNLGTFLLALILLGACAPKLIAEEALKSNSIEKLKKEAEEGNSRSQYWLGVCYNQGDGGVKQDDAEAYKWFRKAQEGGYDDAHYMLGLCYKDGHGVAQNYAEAIKIFRKDAEQGESSSQHEMGLCYFKGLGVQQDVTKAISFWRQSSKTNWMSQMALGQCYSIGKGVIKDMVQAYMWFDIAANDGFVDKAVELRELVAKNMTAEQIVEAKNLSKEWKLKKK